MSIPSAPFRIACDSVVALPPRTRGSRPIFAKNSDRPPDEAQPLIQVAAADHRPGSKLRCQYIEIDQVSHTHAFLGSRPHWLWGCEHGVNEHGVAIGNHTIYTKDPLGETGLQGMDLVRLGLERGDTAREAADVIATLIETHGQGGSGFADLVWPYNNSFVVADAAEAWLLEASASHWALKRLREGGSASNHTTIGSDWDELSGDCVAHAIESGWWSGQARRFDFAAAYRDESVVPAVVSSGRYRTTCGALAAAGGGLDVSAFKRIMRDHYEAGDVHAPGRMPDDERFFSVCMHAGPVGMTAASMIVELGAAPDGAPRPVWVSFCNPCVSPYFPVFAEAPIPAQYVTGGSTAEDGSAWWRFKRLLTAVEQDFPRHARRVRDTWSRHEREVEARTGAVVAQAAAKTAPERTAMLATFMREVWTETESVLDRLIADVEA
ncbi:MAG TPA: C69 family dipeptidase [Candidatus Binatia bacterium]|nr:C69 family dipeptidase [Candidatus Binatia bacterium]